MHEVEVLLGLLVVVAALVAVSRHLSVPYPVLLVLGGLVLALVPGLPTIQLNPDLIFLLFLPPLLYWETLSVPFRDLRANTRPILWLAIGLVLATTGAVAWVAHRVIPGLTWPAAFVLGAILAPTDEVAATEVATRLPIPRRVLTILEGESLINDAISLVAYRMAVAAAVTGAFSLRSASLQFLAVGLGGVSIGLAVGWGIAWLRRRLLADPPVENTISFLTPFAAYLLAEALGASVVLAVVTIGLYWQRQGPRIVSSRARLQAQAVWQMLSFLLNGLLFILTGLQLRLILSAGLPQSVPVVLGYIASILVTLILVRALWVFLVAYVPRALSPRLRRQDPYPPWQSVLLIVWTGIRGGISLLTALAIPLTLAGGQPFPQRSLILYIAFVIILATLLLQGLSLPWLIRLLKIPEEDGWEQEETRARLAAIHAALSHLDTLAPRTNKQKDDGGKTEPGAESIPPETIADLRHHYLMRKQHLASRARGEESDGDQAQAEAYRKLRRDLIQAERETVIRLRDEDTINDEVLRRIQRDLDLEEIRLGPPLEP
ncbi:MAG TPA: Na+/H+ antiporter [Chthonomonadaceae bacterium]|nr:Na+/H+ antiporter [Chthonomonadaceae bacterium]